MPDWEAEESSVSQLGGATSRKHWKWGWACLAFKGAAGMLKCLILPRTVPPPPKGDSPAPNTPHSVPGIETLFYRFAAFFPHQAFLPPQKAISNFPFFTLFIFNVPFFSL